MISATPATASAVALNQTCSANGSTGVCTNAGGGNSVCSLSNVLGTGNCDPGLLCCGQAAVDECTTLGANCTLPTTGNRGKCVQGDYGNLVCGLGGTQTSGSSGVQNQTNGSSNTQTQGPSITLVNPLNLGNCTSNNTCISVFVGKILQLVIKIGTVIIILMLVYVGYMFVAAQGVPGKIEEARKALLWTVVGALILLGAEAIAKGIEATVKAISVGQ